MVTLKKRLIAGRTYYYLEHSVRKKGRVEKREKYLGKTMPNNIQAMKAEFLYGIYREKWFDVFDRIKKNHSKEEKLTPESARQEELKKFSIRFTYDTQRIEGSNLTLRETAELLEAGIAPRGKPIRDVKEAEAHQKIFNDMLKQQKDLSLQLILYWHKQLFEATRQDIAGKIRKHQVAISGSEFLPPSPAEILPLLRDFFRWYERSKLKLHPVELASLAHLKFVTVHPFADGNGRISRLIMNFILDRRGFPMFNIAYQNRSSYYNALERSQTKKQDQIFMQWLFRRYVKEYRRYA
jgi:Fic family protein